MTVDIRWARVDDAEALATRASAVRWSAFSPAIASAKASAASI
ncbi:MULTISPECIES: hypothetical protein [unclassified Mesorhizobium]|nr:MULTISPECIES: hypothetical protein [unclassified Mesorhizobium]